MSTDHVPYWVNQSLALLTSLRLTPGILSAARLMRCRPTQREMPYKVQAPSTEPMVAQMIAPGKLKVPRAAVKPASGRMTSDGMGGKMDSRAMAKATPIPPMVFISMISQSVMVPIRPGSVVVQMGVGSVARIVAAAMEKLIEGIVPRFSKNQKHDARRCAFY